MLKNTTPPKTYFFMKKIVLNRKGIFPVYYIFLFILLLSNVAHSQQTIGSFPYMDGGFEGQTATSSGTTMSQVLSSSAWTVSSNTNSTIKLLINNPASARTGNNYASHSTAAANVRLQSPTTATTSNAPTPGLQYTVQYYYKTSTDQTTAGATQSLQGSIYNDATNSKSGVIISTYQSGVWTKGTYTAVINSATVAASTNFAGVRYLLATTSNVLIDDFVVYAGAVDTTVPDASTPLATTNLTATSATLNWTAPTTGVDGGGYMIVRYATNPNADNDPNVNGIYSVGNTITNGTGSLSGTVVYIGTGTTFVDSSLTSGLSYYYKIYTLDKAFNYSAENQVTVTTLSAPSTPVASVSTTATTSGFTANWNTIASATSYNFYLYEANTVQNIVGWTFPASWTAASGVTPAADIYNTNNASKVITQSSGTVTAGEGTGGSGTFAIQGASWYTNFNKYWEIQPNTTGYKNIKISSKLFSTAPRDFKLQYKIGVGGTYVDVPGGAIVCSGDWGTGNLNNIVLPAECENQASLYLRWINYTTVDYTTGTALTGGTVKLDDILVTGNLYQVVAGYPINVTSNSTTITGLNPGNTYYYEVNASNGSANSANSNQIIAFTKATQDIADFRTTASGNFSNAAIWEWNDGTGVWNVATQAPSSTNNILVNSGHEVNLTSSISIGLGKTFSVNGTLNLDGKVISGLGSFITYSGSSIKLGDIESLTTAVTTSSFAYNSGANYIYNGITIAQNTSLAPSGLTGNMTISNPIGVTLSQSLKVYLTSTLLVSSTGKLLFGDGTTLSAILSGNGNFNAQSGSTLVITSADGICTGTTNGNIRNSGTRTFSSGVNYNFTKNDLVTPVNSNMGTAFTIVSPATTPEITSINNLIVNNALNVIVPANINIDGALTFVSGKIETGSNTITLGTSGSIVGAGTGWVIGKLNKQTASGSSPSFLYAIGDSTNYIPLNLTFTGNNTATTTGNLLASTSPGDHISIATSGLDSAKSVNRTWTLTNNGLSGFGTYTASFTYPTSDNDSSTNAINYVVRRFENSAWSATTASVTATNTSSSSNGISGFGDFAIGETTGLPTFSSQPTNITICAGSNTSFNANTTTTLPTSIKWQRSVDGNNWVDVTANLDSGTTYSDFTTSTLVLTGSNNTINNYQYKAICSTINGSVSSNNAIITVVTTAAPIATAQSFCDAGTISQLSASGTLLNWYSSGIGGAALSPSTDLSSATYHVTQTLNSCESSRTAVLITINTTPSSPTASAQTLCNSGVVSSLVATGTGLNWYSTSTGGSALAPSATINSGTYYVSQTVNTCEGLRTSVLVTVNNSAAPIATNSQYFCVSGTVAGLTATGSTLNWYSSATGGTALSPSTSLVSGTYYVSQTSNACESSRSAVAVSVTAIPTAPTAASQTFCNSGIVGSLNANGIGLLWYSSNTGGTALSSSAALSTGTYYVSQTINTCESSRTAVSVTVINASTSAPSASAQTFCNSGTISNLTATGTNLNWYSNSFGGAALTPSSSLTSGTYYVSQTQNSCESNRTAVTVTVNIPTPPSATSQTFCNSGTVAGLVATGTALQWYSGVTGGTALLTSSALTNGNYYVSQTLNACESARTSVSVSITALPAAPTAAAQTFCNSGTISGLTATGTALNWYSSASGGSALSPSTSLATGSYYVSQTINACESNRTSVSVVLNISNAPTASAQTFCNSGTVAELTATGTALNWYSVTIGGTALVTSTALATGTYYVSQTLNACESSRASVAVTLNVTNAPSALGQTFCNSGTVAQLSATGTALNWYSNASGGTALPLTSDLSTGNYYVSQTLNACESNRTLVAVTLNITNAPNASSQTFCNSGTVSGLTATGTALNWYSNETGGSALTPSTVLTSGTYYVSQTLNACQSNRTSVQVTVNITPAPSASAQSFCYSGTVAGLVANGTALNWYSNSSTQTVLASTTALISGTYYVSQTLNSCQSTRTSVVVTINSTAIPTASSQIFCNSGTVSQLTATGSSLQWYSTASGGTALAPTTALSSGTYYVSQTLNSCESINRRSVAVTLNITNAPTAMAQTFCNSGTVAGLTATGSGLKWYSVATGGSILVPSTALTSGTYYVSQTLNTCESTRTSVEVTVNSTTAPTATTQNFCNSGLVSDLTAIGTGLQWYLDAIGGVALTATTPLVSGTYYASQTLNACESSRTSVTVTVNPTTSAPTASAQTFCNSGLVSDLTATGSGLIWYSNATGGTSITPSTTLATGTYYVSQTLNTCESSRTSVDVTVITTSAPTASAQTFCNSGLVSDLTATGSGLIWYSNATGGTSLTSSTTLATGTYYVSQTLNTCESTRTSVAVTVNIPSAPTASPQTFCNSGLVSDLTATGSGLIWYSNATGGTSLNPSTTLVTGTYYVSQTLNTCESGRTSIAVTVNAIAAPTGNSPQVFNTNNPVLLSDLVVAGIGVVWYSSSANAISNSNALGSSTVLVSGNTYYAMQTINGCSSSTPLAVVVTINLANANFDLVDLEYYPNPVTDNLNLLTNQKIDAVTIYNLVGQQLKLIKPNTTMSQIDMSNFPQGTYILQIESIGKQKIIKITKK